MQTAAVAIWLWLLGAQSTAQLSGQVRDPLVGRDILVGVALGVVWLLIFEISYIPQAHVGAAPPLNSAV